MAKKVSDQSMHDSAKAVNDFWDALNEHGISGSAVEKIVQSTAPIIVSYVLYHHTTPTTAIGH